MSLIKQNYKTMSQLARKAVLCKSRRQPALALLESLGGAEESWAKHEQRVCARGAWPVPTRDAAQTWDLVYCS